MISKELLKQIIVDQRANLLRKPLGVEREALEIIRGKYKIPHVIVLTGMRRSGKSTLLRQAIASLYNNENFFYLNFEDERLSDFKASEFNSLYEILLEINGPCRTFFIDEIQNIEGFEGFVRRFHDNGFKFFITGSNARLLSKEIGTKLTGRHIDIEVKPFSFGEYLKVMGSPVSRNDLYLTESRAAIKMMFNNYLFKGGLPEFVLFDDMEILTRIYEDIVIKDVVVRYNIDDIKRSKQLYSYLISNCGQKFNYNSLKKIFDFGSGNTVRSHIGYLEETYLLRIVEPFQFSLKKQIAGEKKAYTIDNGLIKAVSTKYSEDRGWLLENLVVNSFPSQCKLFYYAGTKECDLIVSGESKQITPMQITWELTEQNTRREVEGLTEALKTLRQKKGLILTYDTEDEIHIDEFTIEILPVWKWLLTKGFGE